MKIQMYVKTEKIHFDLYEIFKMQVGYHSNNIKNTYFNLMMATIATTFKMNFHCLISVCRVVSHTHAHFYQIL